MHSDPTFNFNERVVIVTGAGAGLGRAYAIELARLGARVIVNSRSSAAEETAKRIRDAGGDATACCVDVRDGHRIAQCAMDSYGRIDALLANAGIIRDRTFTKMTAEDWDEVISTHLAGTHACVKAIWPHMVERRYGRIVLTSSGAAFHGNFGQSNYAAAKAALIGFAKTLALEGERFQVAANVLAPMALTSMNDSVFDSKMKTELTVERLVPFALALCHEHMRDTGLVIEAGGGWGAALRWQRAAGVAFDDASLSMSALLTRWADVKRFDDGADIPHSVADSLRAAIDGLERPHVHCVRRDG